FLSQALREASGVPKDLDRSVALMRKSAEIGNLWAAMSLGDMYAGGWYGVEKDLEEATRWKTVAAKAGDPEAQGWLSHRGLSW
ncbi:MAG: sel1 repeat family protein, partial [Acidobacteria bacterium]|nr:sel1 repeat family protein [Acidobacteriota bacterium]